MKITFSYIVLFSTLLLTVACKEVVQKENPVLAEVGSKKLFLKDIASFIPDNITTLEDSIVYLNLEVEEWVRDQIVINQGKLSKKEMAEVDALVANYKSNLIQAKIEEAWISSHLDTVVSMDAIEKYKKEHNELFVVDQELIRCTFARIESSKEGLVELDKNWRKGDLNKVKDFCAKNAINAHLNEDEWTSLSLIKKQIPKDLFSNSTFTKKGYNQKSKNGHEYFLQILEYKKTGELPENLIVDRIKKIIIQQRKLDLIKSFKSNLYKEAMNKNQIKKYLDKVK